MTDESRISELETQIAELRRRLPKHSIPPSMLLLLDELEEELERLKVGQARDRE